MNLRVSSNLQNKRINDTNTLAQYTRTISIKNLYATHSLTRQVRSDGCQ